METFLTVTGVLTVGVYTAYIVIRCGEFLHALADRTKEETRLLREYHLNPRAPWTKV